MYNIKKAVSRLEFAPKIDGIKITDIKRGLVSFSPKPDKAVSFAVLKEALKKAGYTLASAEITVSGKLAHDDSDLGGELSDFVRVQGGCGSREASG